MAEEIIVSISLLVSNRIDTIRKCMESIKPLLDAVPSELIAVDTVGEENSDGSIAVVKEYTDHIIYFPWIKDFAAARNVGLKAAKGKWFLTLDDDEWFEDIAPIVDFFKSGDYKKYDRAWYYVRNYHNMAGTEWVDSLADRMCVITKETRYEGRVHECLLPHPERVMQFFCYAHHYGYVYSNAEEKQKHSERNCSLLEIEVKEHPDNARMIGQLAQEYAGIGKLEEGIRLCEDWLDTYKKQRRNPFAQFLAVIWLRMSVLVDDEETSAALLYRLEEEYLLNEMARLACLVEGIAIEAKMKKYKEAIRRAEEYFKLYSAIQKQGTQIVMQQVFDLKKYMEPDYIKRVIFYGLQASILGENYNSAKGLLDNIVWTDTKKKPFDLMMQLVELYAKSGRGDLFYPYAAQIINNPGMKNPFLVCLENLMRDYPERKAEVRNWLNGLNGKKTDNPELEHLAKQLKKNIKALIGQGKILEAKQLVLGLKEITPADPEVCELEKMFISLL